ncbi:hypothetical protein SAMN05720468_1368 [Fibrobacter sp. UWEL]|nr:hypothetical protein SAMN05720468_1368 [Fibrobacter sp. UWEL]
MPEAIIQLYNSLDSKEQEEVNDFIVFLLSQKKKRKVDTAEALNGVLGLLNPEEAENIRSAHLMLKEV